MRSGMLEVNMSRGRIYALLIGLNRLLAQNISPIHWQLERKDRLLPCHVFMENNNEKS